jgi:phosphate starvation-inducible PhoH-like protein
MMEATITLDSPDEAVRLFGARDQHLKLLREALGARIIARGDTVQITGTDEQVEQTRRAFQQLRGMLKTQG